MIYTLTTNPSIDYYLYGEDEIHEGIIRPNKYEFIVAGKGINVSKMLSILTEKTICVVVCGGFTGEHIASELEKEKLLKPIIVRINENSRINVKTRFGGKERDFNSSGPMLEELAKQELIKIFNNVKQEDYVCINGSLQLGMKDTLMTIAKNVSKKKAKLILDVPNLTKEEIIECMPYLIKPNQDELLKLLNGEVRTDIIRQSQKEFAEKGINVFLSLGEKGSCYINKEKIIKVSCPKIDKIVNTVAAGDSLLAGYLYMIKNGKSVRDSLVFASACGSASVASSYLPTKELIDSLVDKVILEEDVY